MGSQTSEWFVGELDTIETFITVWVDVLLIIRHHAVWFDHAHDETWGRVKRQK